jgi:hypothetical protein
MTPDYWTLTNISYQHWKKMVLYSQKWPWSQPVQMETCRAQADYVMYAALEVWEVNHGKRKV